MAFEPVQYDEGKTVKLPFSTGETVVRGGAVVADTDGYYIMAGSSTATDIYYVALETVTTTADGDMVLCLRVHDKVIFEVDTDANPARTDVGTLCDLASVSTANPDASTNDLFYIEDIVGAVADKKIRGFFVDGVGNS
jgi:hypothetical protein